jgi:hypothetical protein
MTDQEAGAAQLNQRQRPTLMGWLRRGLLGISTDEALFTRRGFRGRDEHARARIELIGKTFIGGYVAALELGQPERLSSVLAAVTPELQGFAYEGAAMGLAILDRLLPGKGTRLRRYLAGVGSAHVYMLHVGAGWAAARLPFRLESTLCRLDSLLGWLAVDGYGFHEGYFHWPVSVVKQARPKGVNGYACRAFDQGLGRSLWFVNGADVELIPSTIADFPEPRRADLWSGVGLACTYAGGVGRDAVAALVEAAGSYRPELAQGAAFAAKARLLPGLGTDHTDLACELICGMPAAQAAAVTDSALYSLPADSKAPPYEVWRRLIRDRLS